MGERMAMQDRLFYEFRLEEQVPAGHLLRIIDRFIDLSDLRRHLAGFYSSTGRPSVDPELIIRMLIVGYCYGIRSERRLCEEVHLNLAYRWFCELGLEGQVPDHSTFSKNRHGRFSESNAFRHLFETVVERCIGEGLVGGEGFAVDASLIQADANRQRSIPGSDWNRQRDPEKASRTAREYLATLDDAAKKAGPRCAPVHCAVPEGIALAETAVAVLREGRMVGHLAFQTQPTKPPIGQVEVHLLAQPPLRADAIAVAHQQHPDHQLRINRRPASGAIEAG